MGEAGLFADERVELLDGTIVTMSPQTTGHAGTITKIQRTLSRAFGDAATLRVQLPVVLDDWSEPEPDFAICVVDPRNYFDEHPHAEHVLVACEVAVSSLGYDRTQKAAAYARAGIREYWIVDVERGVLHVLTDPDPATATYHGEQTLNAGDEVLLPNGTRLSAADLLPP
jgi:Uma2 family endonuclease